jgi:hypothetical protein
MESNMNCTGREDQEKQPTLDQSPSLKYQLKLVRAKTEKLKTLRDLIFEAVAIHKNFIEKGKKNLSELPVIAQKLEQRHQNKVKKLKKIIHLKQNQIKVLESSLIQITGEEKKSEQETILLVD